MNFSIGEVLNDLVGAYAALTTQCRDLTLKLISYKFVLWDIVSHVKKSKKNMRKFGLDKVC